MTVRLIDSEDETVIAQHEVNVNFTHPLTEVQLHMRFPELVFHERRLFVEARGEGN